MMGVHRLPVAQDALDAGLCMASKRTLACRSRSMPARLPALLLQAWFNASEDRRRKRLRRERAVMHWKNMNLIKAWNSWWGIRV